MDSPALIHLELFDCLALSRCCKVLRSCVAASIAHGGGNAQVIDCLISGVAI